MNPAARELTLREEREADLLVLVLLAERRVAGLALWLPRREREVAELRAEERFDRAGLFLCFTAVLMSPD